MVMCLVWFLVVLLMSYIYKVQALEKFLRTHTWGIYEWVFEALEFKKLLTLTIVVITSWLDYKLMDLDAYVKGAIYDKFNYLSTLHSWK